MRPTASASAMDGKLITGIGLLLIPAVLLGAVVVWLSSNPIWIFILLSAMVAGAIYLLTYREAFA